MGVPTLLPKGATGTLVTEPIYDAHIVATNRNTQSLGAVFPVTNYLNGGTDYGAAANAAIALAADNGGGIVLFPSGSYNVSTPIVQRSSHVRLVGSGRGTPSTATGRVDAATILNWTGGTGATMCLVGPADAPYNSTGSPVTGSGLNGASVTTAPYTVYDPSLFAAGTYPTVDAIANADVRGLFFNGNGVAAIGVQFKSVTESEIDIAVSECTSIHADFNVAVTTRVNNFRNNRRINVLTKCSLTSCTTAIGVRVGASSRIHTLGGIGNTSQNWFERIQCQTISGNACMIMECDNIYIEYLYTQVVAPVNLQGSSGYVAGQTETGYGLYFGNDPTSNDNVASSNTLRYVNCNTAIIAKGGNGTTMFASGSAGPISGTAYQLPSPNRIIILDTGNGTPLPIIEAGAYLYYGIGLQIQTGGVYNKLNASGFLGATPTGLQLVRGNEGLALTDGIVIYNGDAVNQAAGQAGTFTPAAWAIEFNGYDLLIAPTLSANGAVNVGNGQPVKLPGTVLASYGVGFYGASPPTSRPVVTGSRSTATASVIESLLSALASLGIVTDSTST